MMLIDYQNINIYQADNLILQDVNLQVNEGEFIYIIGKVGTGKSSLLKSLYCELDLEQENENQKAEVLGRDLFDLKRKEVPALRKDLGIIFQDFQLLHDRSVRRNLRFVLEATGWKGKDEINERIESVLKEVGMLDKIDKMPHELSGGEQQRIAIARAILNQPKMIIADEPTGNLDAETAGNIVSLLKNITGTGAAVIMTTHNISMLNQFPGIVYRCKDKTLQDVTNEHSQLDLINEEEEEEERADDAESVDSEQISDNPSTK
uniref:ATP-binding cassette domain-containing protein n=1 Tax=Prevotella sp. GTC17262 TaxID=3236797 RepID=A0AB33JQT4_9BACT